VLTLGGTPGAALLRDANAATVLTQGKTARRKEKGRKMKLKPNVRRVLTLLGIMLGMACPGLVIVPKINLQMDKANVAVGVYWAREGDPPESLEVLTRYPIAGELLLEAKDLIDPWGEPIGYAEAGGRYAIWSTGPDKIMGTRDDYIEGHHSLYVECWRALQVQSGMDAEAAKEAVPESIARLPKPAPPLSPEEQARLEEEARKESEQAGEEYRRTRQVFLRKFWTGAIIRILGIVLVLGIAAAAVWSRARKKSGRK
jgi:hypothetical protein